MCCVTDVVPARGSPERFDFPWHALFVRSSHASPVGHIPSEQLFNSERRTDVLKRL